MNALEWTGPAHFLAALRAQGLLAGGPWGGRGEGGVNGPPFENQGLRAKVSGS